MKILSAEDMQLWDQFTIEQEPISSINLMERAAKKCVEWLLQHYPATSSFGIFCGKGNNGGDGLAIARLLMEQHFLVTVYILEFGFLGSPDFQTNLERLHKFQHADIHFIQSEDNLHSLEKSQIIIDALFGTGLSRPLEGLASKLVNYLNNSGCEIVSIDISSGLFADCSSMGAITVHPNHTLSFQNFKTAFFIRENEESLGEIHLLDIGLLEIFYTSLNNRFELLDKTIIQNILKHRKNFSHKGDYGHALLIAGSYGKMGAAVLSAKASMRSGIGLLTCHIPKCGYDVLQTTVPEAMVVTDCNNYINTKVDADLSKFASIGIGPGLGTATETTFLLHHIFANYQKPIVLDADALNLLSIQKELLKQIPANSILTPHPKEFERLFGKSANDFDQINLALEKAQELNCIIIVKGKHTFIATNKGKGFFNSTGNPGMATAGSGDVLTGIITGLLAQGYDAKKAAILGVYLHGLAGDISAKNISKEALIAGDIIDNLGMAFSSINN